MFIGKRIEKMTPSEILSNTQIADSLINSIYDDWNFTEFKMFSLFGCTCFPASGKLNESFDGTYKIPLDTVKDYLETSGDKGNKLIRNSIRKLITAGATVYDKESKKYITIYPFDEITEDRENKCIYYRFSDEVLQFMTPVLHKPDADVMTLRFAVNENV